MPHRSFWENLGRGMGRGWKRAVEITDRMADHAEGRLDLAEARQRQERRLQRLGEQVARAAIDEKREEISLRSTPTRELLEAIREGREQIRELEEEAATRPESESSCEPDAATATDTAAEDGTASGTPCATEDGSPL